MPLGRLAGELRLELRQNLDCNLARLNYAAVVRPRLSAWIGIGVAVLIVVAASIPFAAARLSVDKPTIPPAPSTPQLQPIFTVSVGMDGEIFPAFANYASLQKTRDRQLATVSVTITNPGRELLRTRVTVHFPGWSDQEIQFADVAAGAVRTFQFAPVFFPRLYSNREITAATAVVSAQDLAGKPIFSTTVPVRLRAAQDMYWGAKFRYAPFIASWVTPHDPQVDEFLAEAKEFAPLRRLPGYEAWKNKAAQVNSTYEQARAIYRAMQARGLSYVKSSMTFGRNAQVSERIRFPRESLQHVSANCIDAVVAYASIFENLGMDPAVVLVPGHAYIGIREADAADQYLYLDVALTGRASFETAVLSASQGMRRFQPSQIMYISVANARRQGIYPMPGFSGAAESAATSVESAASHEPKSSGAQ